MPKLKGLLDSANAKLAGLLGDFPQGFNAGAVAGFPGWAGDMAYLADTARLALTGADSQAAPEDYVGTTDYIAKQAGYPVPQTLSGQLGAAVGGLMSPGPGDLAKFAPVLSAIPFWHGSPHKFDAFDLSHMGKGEGAQAYGWGAYGAESPEVAKQYLNVDPSVPVPPRRQFMGQDLEPGTPEYHAARLASEGKESLAGLRKLVAGWISDARPGEPTDGYQKTLEILNQAQKKSDFKQLKPEPYLYRGEYRWPDPAKESATPLTGEDLLQWDRPLSEQPDSVRKALGVKVRDFAAEDALLAKAQAMGVPVSTLPEYEALTALMDEAAPFTRETGGDYYKSIKSTRYSVKNPETGMYESVDANTRADAIRAAGGDASRVREIVSYDQDKASKRLSDLGIPGIRYLDGMSRDGGQGTYNYVMFDDKGIKLLERNGSPLQASNVRFDDSKTWYHTTTEDFTEFDPSKGSKTAAFGPGIYVSEDVNDSARWAKSKEGARTIAVQLAPEHILSGPLSEQQAQQLSEYLGREVKAGDPIPYLSLERRGGTVSEGAKAAGFAGVEHYGSGAGANAKNIVITDPTQVKIIDHGRNGNPIEDFAARRAGKAKPYREAMGADTMPAMPKQEQPKTVPDYAMEHRPPMRDSGAPGHDLTGGGSVYPDDVYQHGARYYGTGDDAMDYESFRLANYMKGRPERELTIYRAVPYEPTNAERLAKLETQKAKYMARRIVPSEWGGGKNKIGDEQGFYSWVTSEIERLKSEPESASPKLKINAGDWISINKQYAKQHGEREFGKNYKVITKKVKAKDIYTNGDSIHEWGYDPDGL